VAVFYHEEDARVEALELLVVGVVGYGNLGRSLALNLRDSGLNVLVGNIDDEYRKRAIDEGFEAVPIEDAVARSDIVWVVVPDEVIPSCFLEAIAPSLRPEAAVCFASGYPLAYGLVKPPSNVDVLLIAPRMLGVEVRSTYLEGSGYVSFVSVEHNASGLASERLLALARAAGALRRGALELSAVDEATLDLFIEQSVGPWLGTALLLAFQLGVEAGLPPEALVLELYMSGEMSRTFQTFADVGFLASVGWHGLIAAYGGFVRTLTIDRDGMERDFREALDEIRSGRFALRLQDEEASGYPTLAAIEAMTSSDNPITEAEERVRAALRMLRPVERA
jgi:ketol-acid reductoisomerase